MKSIVYGAVVVTMICTIAKAEFQYPIMQPSLAEMQEWIASFESAPLAHIDPSIGTMPAHKDLLSYLDYVPAQYNQNNCGNCWQWAGTSVVDIAQTVQEGLRERFSIQYINSCEASVIGNPCCAGGSPSYFCNFYNATGILVPWSNGNAHWQDGDVSCDTSCASISTSPNYPLDSISYSMVNTHGVSRETAINNIKNVLNQNKAMYFSFSLPSSLTWNVFYDFWNTYNESILWSPDYSCGQTYIEGQGGGHAVCCVGYDDSDPGNRYWIMVNSWGASSNRPNCIFHLNMDMDYDCALYRDGWNYSTYFFTIDPQFSSTQPEPEVIMWMPSNMFHPGDYCTCYAAVNNTTGATIYSHPLFVVLDMYGAYYFAPSFGSFDYIMAPQAPGYNVYRILPDFYWPNGMGSASNIRWLGALTTPDMTSLYGTMGTFTFGWGTSTGRADLRLSFNPAGGYASQYSGGYYYYDFSLILQEAAGIGVTLDTMHWEWYDQYGGYLGDQVNGGADIAGWFDLPGAYLPGGGYRNQAFYFRFSSPSPVRCVITMGGRDDYGNYVTAASEYWGYGPP
ncbi:C1 family peptidase [bacterium]|nr:C1 family peptidase [candidate division CSSED10-310 bacterium]